MTYAECSNQAGRVCLEIWIIDSPVLPAVLAMVAALFVIKMFLKVTPFIG